MWCVECVERVDCAERVESTVAAAVERADESNGLLPMDKLNISTQAFVSLTESNDSPQQIFGKSSVLKWKRAVAERALAEGAAP